MKLFRVSVSAKNDTSVLKTAKVENHVLSFDPVNVASDVTTTCSYKSLTKKGFKYTAPKATNTAFTTSGFEEVAGVSYTFVEETKLYIVQILKTGNLALQDLM